VTTPGYGAYPPAPYAPPGPPVRRRRSRWLTIGLPLGLVLLLGGCATAVVLLVHALGDAIGPAKQAADDWAQALVEQRWDDAQGQLCAGDRAVVTAADLSAHYASPPLTGYRLEGVHVTSVNGDESADAEIAFTTADGLGTRTTLPLAKEDGGWRPCP
jgi:hypothetical protein